MQRSRMLDIGFVVLVAVTTQALAQLVGEFNGPINPGYAAVTPFQVTGCMQNDQCMCSVSSNWSALVDYRELQQAKSEVAELHEKLSSLEVQTIVQEMETLSDRLQKLEVNVHNQTIGFSIQETNELKRNVEILKEMLDNLTMSENATAEQMELSNRVNKLSATLEAALNKNPYGQNSNLKEELAELRTRLSECHDNVSWTAFPGDELPVNNDYSDWCADNEVEGIGEAITHKYLRYDSGAWGKDPLPASEANRAEIYERPYGYSYTNRYEYYPDFIQGKNSKRLTRFHTYGVGYVFYNQSIYYSYSNYIYRYYIPTGNIISRRITKSNLNYDNQPINSFVDFKVDESGLWTVVAQAENNEKLVVMKRDPNSLEMIGKPFRTNKLKSSVCATFIICGTLYAVEDCKSRLPASFQQTKSYFYNTETGASGNTAIHPASKYGHISSVNYSPREQLLFVWDSKHLVTYKVNWKPKKNPSTTEGPKVVLTQGPQVALTQGAQVAFTPRPHVAFTPGPQVAFTPRP